MSSLSYFNTVASQWNQMRSVYFDEMLKKEVVQKEAIERSVIVDLGAGTGFLTLELAQRAELVFALDQSKNMLAELNQIAQLSHKTNIYPIVSKMTAIPLFDESVDFVFSNMALHHVEKPLFALKEAHRILKKGGKLILSDVASHDGTWAKEEMFDVWLGFSENQLNQWLKEAGYQAWQIEMLPFKAKATSSKGVFTEANIYRISAIK